jgi:hypothetical protein
MHAEIKDWMKFVLCAIPFVFESFPRVLQVFRNVWIKIYRAISLSVVLYWCDSLS